MDWQTFLFDPKSHWIARFERLAKRRLIDPNLADQAVEQCLAKLQNDNWARLGDFQAAANPAAFLSCVFRHLLEDFAIARFGKCRAPVWVQQLGLNWVTLYKRLCCERQELEAVITRIADTTEQAQQHRQMARTLKAKIPHCGSRTQFQSLEQLSDEQHEQFTAQGSSDPTQAYEQQLCHDVQHALTESLGLHHHDADSSSARQLSVAVFHDLDIDVDTRLLLKLIYQDDISLPKAAQIVGVAEHTARRQIKRALNDIQARLSQAGFDWQDWSKHHD